MDKVKNSITAFLREQEKCISEILADTDDLTSVTRELIKARDRGSKIFTMGNGGSGATASHFVSDLLKTAITDKKKRFQAISLVDNVPVLLAWSNDSSYDDIFVEQLKNHLSKNDVVLAFSGSGKSKNVIKALEYAKRSGAICVGMTGISGGLMKKICDICLRIPSDEMLTIESQHVLMCHCIVTAIRDTGNPLFKYE
jgi:D-sedoheptulose 7-phosphate isomerase